MFASIFNPENSFWRMISKCADVLLLSALWLICSLPLVTLGAATAALYDASVKCVRGREQASWRRFFRTFRRELGTATLATVIWGAALLLMVWILRVLWAGALADVAGAPVAAAAYFVLMLIPAGSFCWMFPVLSRFTFRAGGLILTGLRLAIGYLPYTLLVVLVTLAAALAAWMLVVLALILPCLTALAWSLVMERVFRKYMPEEPAIPEVPEDPELPGE